VAELGWTQTNPNLALTFPFLATATGAFLFRQHFSNIPRELADAAQIDGASPLRFLFAVLIPMSWNVIAAHALIQFIASWNQYIWARLVLPPDRFEVQLIQIGVRNAGSGPQTDFGLLMAAGIVASLPPLILFLLLQKQFMSGFAITRDK
jgi:sn-glycerol 3-phosphate transport system permease protein